MEFLIFDEGWNFIGLVKDGIFDSHEGWKFIGFMKDGIL